MARMARSANYVSGMIRHDVLKKDELYLALCHDRTPDSIDGQSTAICDYLQGRAPGSLYTVHLPSLASPPALSFPDTHGTLSITAISKALLASSCGHRRKP